MNITSMPGESEIALILTEMNTRFEQWEPDDERSREGLWKCLGYIYEVAAKIETDESMRLALATNMRKHANLSNFKWERYAKTTIDKLLLVRFRFDKAKAATKSQYKAALSSALEQGVPREEAAFIEWVRKVGGVVQAGKARAKAASFNVEECVEQLVNAPSLLDGDIQVDRDMVFHHGCAVALIQQVGSAGYHERKIKLLHIDSANKPVETMLKRMVQRQERDRIHAAAEQNRKTAKEEKAEEHLNAYGNIPPKRKSPGKVGQWEKKRSTGNGILDFVQEDIQAA